MLKLGAFEQLVLLATLRAGEEAFAVAILRELDDRTGRQVDRGALYTTLDRLERKGFVEWSVEAGSPERGGRRRRLFRVTPLGLDALSAQREVLFGMWEGLEAILGGAE